MADDDAYNDAMEDREREEMNEDWADRKFPDRGAAPSNEVKPDGWAAEAPNIGHPR